MSDLLHGERVRLNEAVRLAGVCRRTVQRWIATGKVRACKVGRNIQVVVADLEAMLEPVKTTAEKKQARPKRVNEAAQKKWRDEVLADIFGKGRVPPKKGSAK